MKGNARCVCALLVFCLACGRAPDATREQAFELIGDGADPNPVITFTQVASSVGINRSNEPPSAGPFSSSGTLAYGGWLADLDGDGRLDYYGVNHGQSPHLSGLFINNGAGGFGRNLFTVALQRSQASWPNLELSNEMTFVGDLTGDGRVDFFFRGCGGLGWPRRHVRESGRGPGARLGRTGLHLLRDDRRSRVRRRER